MSFCACYIYSPHGGSYGSQASRLLCTRLKKGDPVWLPIYARRVQDQTLQHEVLASVFAKESVLVPVPGSAPSPRGLWAAQRLAFALHGVGLGDAVWTGVERRFPVRKSATALSANRPTVRQHYESFAVADRSNDSGSRYPPTRLVIIDDVITKGRTILAAAVRLHEAFPHADIRAFALVRTMGFLPDVLDSFQPCEGVVEWAAGDARRQP